MEEILLLLLLAGFVLGFAFWSSLNGKLKKIEAQNRNLNHRLKQLEAGGPDPTAIKSQAKAARSVEVEAEPARAAAKAAPAPKVTKEPEKPASKQPPPPEKPAQKPKPKQSLEDRIGGQWSVWVGGLALLLGAVLLIRYSIEAGFFGPGARIVMAYGLGAILLAVGEWLRRADAKLPGRLAEATKSLDAHIPIPTLLSAIGVFTWLGATYAAHELYGFISAPVAFAGLGLISVGAMALSLRQGQWLALIGLLASFATPLLIQTDTPSLIGLYGYLLIIGAAALVLSHRTGWGWLALGVVSGLLGWSALSLRVDFAMSNQMIWLGFLGLGFGVTVWLASRNADIEVFPKQLRDLKLTPLFALIWGGVGAALSLSFLLAFESEITVSDITRDAPVLLDYLQIIAVIGVLCLAGLVFRRQAGHIVTGAVVAFFCCLGATTLQLHLVLGVIAAVTILLMIRQSLQILDDVSAPPLRNPLVWAVGAAILALLGALPFEAPYYDPLSEGHYAIWFALYLALFALVAALLHKRDKPALTMIYALAAAIGYALACLFQFDGLTLNIAFSIGGAIAGMIALTQRVPGTRLAALGLLGLTVLQALLLPLAGTDDLSTRPILNELWIYLALLSFILGGLAFALRRQDRK